jgi:uncharacterized iron-regulated protein
MKPVNIPATPAQIRRRFRQLAATLARTGPILLGTLHERRIPAPAKDGRKAKTYGPYYQWTFKREGRTLTVNLSRAQLRPFRQAIQRQRAVEQTLDHLRALSRALLEATTPGVPKRKPRS